MNTLAPIANKISPLIRMLSSPVDGEVLAACRALGRTLESAGMDFHDLARALEDPAEPRVVIVYRDGEPPPQRDPEPGDHWRDMARRCLGHFGDLDPAERRFLQDIIRWRGKPTRKQMAWLRAHRRGARRRAGGSTMIAAAEIAKGLHKAPKNGKGWKACCPSHDDHEPSLDIDDGPDGKPLVICRAGCTQDAVIAALKGRGLWPEPTMNGHDKPKRRVVATYDYWGAPGALLYQVVRFEPKDFRQRRPDPNRPGDWIWNMHGVSPVPYRLPELVASDPRAVLICEGEKDADAVAKIGLVSTTNRGGAGKWCTELNRWFKGRAVYILPHNDKAGRDHAEQVAHNLHGLAGSVHVVELPDLGDKGDAFDWIAAGGTAEALQQLCQSAPRWQPAVEPEPDVQTTILSSESLGPTPPAFSDEALALRFAERHHHDLRYVAAWGRWLAWDGKRWLFDDTLAAFDRARKICREAAAECDQARIASTLASAKTVAAVERLAKSDRRLAATVDQWDVDPWLLNTPSGVVDLRTADRYGHGAAGYVTKITGVAPGGDCPTWRQFLDRVSDGNRELQGFLQRMAGYALTGSTREHALFFAHGRGANGKSVFVGTITGILGDYATTAPIETFTASNSDRHPTDLAGLRGARLVSAIETEEGRRWAEARIKALTGGDTISARFMRQDFFEFQPQFKLIIAGNHKPSLRSVDEAIRRRFHLIPFTVTIPPSERDLDLPEKLKAEWPGILQWMIDGCRQWQERGLDPPGVVRVATAEYLESEDTFAAWIDECCECDPRAWERTQTLFASWKTWAENSGDYVGNQKTFKAKLEARDGIMHKRESGTGRTGYQGISLKETSQSQPYWDRE